MFALAANRRQMFAGAGLVAAVGMTAVPVWRTKENEMSESIDDFKLLQDSYFRVMTIYYNWYVWFFGENVAAIGLLATSTVVRAPYIRPISIFMECFVILGLFASWQMHRFQASAKQQAQDIRVKNNNDVGIVSDVFASSLAKLASICSIIAHVAATVLWLHVFFYLTGSDPSYQGP